MTWEETCGSGVKIGMVQNKPESCGGASWFDYNEADLLASYRSWDNRDKRQGNIGFRCVLAVEPSQ